MERRLAAILAADVAGYSRLMGADEEGTLALLLTCRSDVLDPMIERDKGRIVKATGDGLLVEFASVVNALRCAIEIQNGMAARNLTIAAENRIEMRVGINVGDVMITGNDIFGDGVNIAARLEALAEPGGICISDRVKDDVRGKIEAEFEDAGEQWLKNIAWPVRVHRVRAGVRPAVVAPTLPLPDKPSIAVLPFQNLSGDPEQDYFADGMVEEIITALSRLPWLFVIARNSSFAYKGRAVDIKQVGRELGVRYVLEGSVRKASARIRITGQLIDAANGMHLWADRFDGGVDDVFELQDQVTARVVGAIAPRLEQAEIERVRRKPTESLDAYDLFLRGLENVYKLTREGTDEALGLFYKAIELDADFSAAYAGAAMCFTRRKGSGWDIDRDQEIVEARRLARRAVQSAKDDATGLCEAGLALAYVVGELDDGAAFLDRALVINPNLASGWSYSGYVKLWFGEPDRAIEHFARAIRLSPIDPRLVFMQSGIASAHFY